MSRPAALVIETALLGCALLTVASWLVDDLTDFALWAWRERWKT